MSASTVTSEVIDVPALVMKALVPLTTHSPPSSRAVVRIVPGMSVPPSGSVSPNPAIRSPAQSAGSQRPRCSSVPNRKMGIAPSVTPASSVIATDESTRASSSIARQSVKKSPPMPPNSSGNGRPNRPSLPMPATMS